MEENISRADAYLEYALKKNNNYPKPVSRQEYYLLSVAEEVRNGGADQATITEAVNSYLEKNPVSSTFDEYLEVNNAIGNLIAGTNLYGMDIKEIIKLMVTKEMPLWNGANIIWGITSMTPEELQSNPVLKIEDYNRETADGNLDYIRIDTTCINQRFIFAVPYNCPLYKILDQNGLDCTDSYTRIDITLDISSLGGFATGTSYIAYILTNTCLVRDFSNYLYFRDV